MLIIYRISLFIYAQLIRLASPFYTKAKDFHEGRRGIFDRINHALKPQERYIWLHASSLGEFEQGVPIIEQLRVAFPSFKILVTFFSPSGYLINRTNKKLDYVFYLPMDAPGNAKRFIEIVNPVMAIFVKYDFWYFYLKELTDRSIPTYFVSSLFSKPQFLFRSTDSFFVPILKKVNHFFIQNEESKSTLQRLGIHQMTVSGDTRFDRVYQRSQQATSFPKLEKFKGENRLVILGSIWTEDMAVIQPLISQWIKEFKIIIAPHEVSPSMINSLLRFEGAQTFSQAKNFDDCRLLIFDTIGMLAQAYQYADVSIIGGGFRGSLHNILEPAAFGCPVLFGKLESDDKFPEAKEMEALGAAYSFSTTEELRDKMKQLMKDEEFYLQASTAAKSFIFAKKGATEQIMTHLTQRTWKDL